MTSPDAYFGLTKLNLMIDINLLYPSVVPKSYLTELGSGNCSYEDFGPNLMLMLSLDLDSLLRNVSPRELADAGVTEADAWDIAWNNLGREIQEGRLQPMIATYEDGGKLICFFRHWLGPAVIYSSGLYSWFRNELGADDLYAIVSDRDNVFVFAANCSALVRDRAEEAARKSAAESRKPFGRNLFRLLDDGPTFVE
jgi:hypothetical protein